MLNFIFCLSAHLSLCKRVSFDKCSIQELCTISNQIPIATWVNHCIPTANSYLVLSPAASWRPPVQRRDPVWSWSQHSGCSPGAESSPAWLTALTSTPLCPSRSLCTSAAPVCDGRGKRNWIGNETKKNNWTSCAYFTLTKNDYKQLNCLIF